MPTPVLVTYATHYGSTREVAEAIAATIRQCGVEVDLKPVREVRAIDGYSGVVLGAPFYVGGWHQDARRFLDQHRQALTGCPIAIFALGPIGTSEVEVEVAEARCQLDRELTRYPWLAPVGLEMFGGKYDPSNLSICHRLLTALPASPLHGLPASDLRDWTVIRRWASDQAERLRPASSPRGS